MDRSFCKLGELKFAKDEVRSFSGYGAVFGNVDFYGDVIRPGAFADSLAESKTSDRWPAMLSQHGGVFADDMMPIGVWTSLSEDGKGLLVEGVLADTPRGEEAYRLLKMQPRPALDGLSIGYRAKEWEVRTKPEEPRRTLKKIDLFEISIVTSPANPLARIDSVKAADMSEREIERLLARDAGFSRSEVRAFMRDGFNGLKALRDAGGEPKPILSPETAGALRRLTEALRA